MGPFSVYTDSTHHSCSLTVGVYHVSIFLCLHTCNLVWDLIKNPVPSGGHIVTTTDCYRRTRQFIQTVLPKMGIGATVINPSDMGALEQALHQHPVSLFFSESPTNPFLRCVDVSTISRLCDAAGALVVIDSTFATPINQRALHLGADLVIHSGTKYLSGHNDVLAGMGLLL